MKKNNKGFTLVELIVVLVILAILAAILVPTLLGYIERARSEKDYSTAQTVRVAAQATIDQAYGNGDKIGNKSGGVDLSHKLTSLEAMDGTFYGTPTVSGDYVALVYSLSGVEKSKLDYFEFTYEDGIIKSGKVTLSGRTYVLRTDGTWSVS